MRIVHPSPCHGKARSVIPEQIPEDLRDRPQWLGWQFGECRRGGRRAKVPLSARTGKKADVTDPGAWTTFAAALAFVEAEALDGIGFALSGDDGLVGTDLDSCRDPDAGVLSPWAEEVVAYLQTYSESSPSGTGLRLFAYGRLPDGRRRRGPVEMYSEGRFLTVTGQRLDGVPGTVEARQQALDDVHRRLLGGDTRSSVPAARQGTISAQTDLRDEELLRLARSAKNGESFGRLWAGDWSAYASRSEADMALMGMLSFWTGPDPERLCSLVRQSGLARDKADRPDYLPRTAAKVIASRTVFYSRQPARLFLPPPCVTKSESRETLPTEEVVQAGMPKGWVKLAAAELEALHPVDLWASRADQHATYLTRLRLICERLQAHAGGRPFHLSGYEAGNAIGVKQRAAARMIREALTYGWLRLERPGERGSGRRKAAEYTYVDPAATVRQAA